MNIMEIENRLNYLHHCVLEEGQTINESSLNSFRAFVEWGDKHGNFLSEPTISLTPDNEIYATWQQVKKHCFRFHADGSIKYVVVDL